MIAPAPVRPPHRRGWLPLLLFGVVYGVTLSVVLAIRAESTSDFRDFWENARAWLSTGEIRDDLGVHNYLPFFTIFMGPFGWLPLRVAAVLFTLLSLGLLGLTVVMTESLLNEGLGPKPHAATLAAIGLMLAYVHSCGVLGQVGLLLLFLVVATWFLVERGQEWPAGIALGLATLIKLLPAALIVFFLLKLRWRVALGAALTCLVLGAGLPLVTLGVERTVAAHRAFYRSAVEEHGAKVTILQDSPRKAKYSNNALPLVLRRLLSPLNGDPSDRDPERRLMVNFADLSPRTIWYVYLTLLALFAGLSVIASWKYVRPWPPPTPAAGLSLRAQYGVWCCLMLLAAPLLWTHYLVLAYWPLALAANQVERRSQRSDRHGLILSVVLIAWLLGVGLLAWPAARAAGAQLWSVAALWLGMLAITSDVQRVRNG